MPAPRNPFKPTAGATPPVLIGRDADLEEFSDSLRDGPGAPGRLVRVTGARGVGKTVMLNELADAALREGWVTVADTASTGMAARLVTAISDHRDRLDRVPERHRSITAIDLPVGAGGIAFSERPAVQSDLRREAGLLLDVLAQHETGLLITVDEMHHGALDELRALSIVTQHLVREDRQIAVAFAGLPSAVSELLNDRGVTFVRRAMPIILADVPVPEVAAALRATIETNGRSITDDALQLAARATNGYPFLVQLVGYHLWRKAVADRIDMASAAAGVDAARRRLGATVHETALADLSAVDRTFLLAMAVDDGPSKASDLASRLAETSSYVSTYRSRLIGAGIIGSVSHGYVDFAIPYLREYLREHGASGASLP
ncbi:ATP-binding protein [Cellulomonas sp. PhB143]|uniref:ATP-binding protein n=1 Tax=Cellulomonas sp. PhB143 TaxID=2485186 RepID=UPI000F48BE71|nr:ATP-binding protein [Cellulomonas sp. PhB143]ROS75406.1 type II secretory pathway predicted ATPase ExeA [Cellulomonas sp. PhB143]